MGSKEEEDLRPLIKQIAPSSVQRIVAGAAVTDLASAGGFGRLARRLGGHLPALSLLVACTAVVELTAYLVKELIDNSIDAGAKRVSIKLFNQGIDSIEVVDNGSGVPATSRPLMAMKHATSKLRAFNDLYTDGSDEPDAGPGETASSSGENDSADDVAYAAAPTLGFRGEALFCLSNLSRSLVVTTRTSDEIVGESFAFNTQGDLISDSKRTQARGVGTTVTVCGLFEQLPVRKVDMCKRIKAQRSKLMKMLQGYAILCLSTQFNLTDVATSSSAKKKSKTEVKLATSESSKTLEARTASVLGPKFLAGLARVEVVLDSAVNDTHGKSDDETKWKMTGLISHAPTSPRPASARDLQFFSINGRPVDLPSVSRVLGDVWRIFDPVAEVKGSGGGRRRPACVLAFTLPPSMYDVNLSPDKREVMFTNEATISALIKEGLKALWLEQSDGQFKTNEVESRSNAKTDKARVVTSNPSEHQSTKGTEKRRQAIASAASGPTSSKQADTDKHIVLGDTDVGEADVRDSTTPRMRRQENSVITPRPTKMIAQVSNKSSAGEESELTADSIPRESSEGQSKLDEQPQRVRVRHQGARGWDETSTRPPSDRSKRRWEQSQLKFQRMEKQQLQQEMSRMLSSDEEKQGATTHVDEIQKSGKRTAPLTAVKPRSKGTADAEAPNRRSRTVSTGKKSKKRQRKAETGDMSFLEQFAYGGTQEQTVTQDDRRESSSESDGSEDEFEDVIDMNREQRSSSKSDTPPRKSSNTQRNARMVAGKTIESTERPKKRKASETRDPSNPSSPTDASSTPIANAEDDVVTWNSFTGTKAVVEQSHRARIAIRKNHKSLANSIEKQQSECANPAPTIKLAKDDFLRMSIIGQFNLGFILARCQNHHLWIIDQHAADEKWNFERLCRDTVIHEQTLIAPLPLELSPSEEHTILENMEVFERNGFRFKFDEAKEPRHRLSLTALPHSGSGGDGKKAVQFGKDDVGALCSLLGADGMNTSDGYSNGFGGDGSRIAGVNAVRRFAGMESFSENVVSQSITRLPKAIAMFANRACRGSIMIGTALSDKEQHGILQKLDQTEIPWNCAHGRPTLSHIRDLTTTLTGDEDKTTKHILDPTMSSNEEL